MMMIIVVVMVVVFGLLALEQPKQTQATYKEKKKTKQHFLHVRSTTSFSAPRLPALEALFIHGHCFATILPQHKHN